MLIDHRLNSNLPGVGPVSVPRVLGFGRPEGGEGGDDSKEDAKSSTLETITHM